MACKFLGSLTNTILYLLLVSMGPEWLQNTVLVLVVFTVGWRRLSTESAGGEKWLWLTGLLVFYNPRKNPDPL